MVYTSDQPTTEMLMEFSGNAGVDWADGVVVLDEDHAIYLLVHKKDLIGKCEIVKVDTE